MVPDRPSGPARDDLFAGGGECGRIMASFDWAATPLGPAGSWPASLRFAVRTVLASRFPMVLTWGPEYRQLYNDSYAPLIGAKHPAIGEDIRITLAEGWAALGPPVDHAMATREASWLPELPLLLERAGFREETYFTVSHAPAFDDDGGVGGMHGVCTEVTAQVIGRRRQRLLHELASTGALLEDERDLLARLCTTLAGDPLDVPVAAVWLAPPEGEGEWERVASVGCAPDALPERLPGLSGARTAADDIGRLGLHGGMWADPVVSAVALPLAASAGAAALGVLVLGCSPNLAADDEYDAFLRLVAGQFAGAVVNARAYEAERRRAESLAELDRAKTTFFSDVSHELRTPLTLLIAPVRDVLEDSGEALGEDGRDRLRLALRNGERLQRLVNDLLEVASIEAGRARPVRVALDVAEFTADLAGVFRAAVERAGLELAVDCPPLRRPAFVDPRMWEKVVVNLLANAVKYTFVGGIDVALHGDDDGFVLTVTDTGVGIVADELPQLFERFHRVPGATARTREGTGIGLALVHELVALHGGTATVASEPGVGSTFTVALPYGAPDVVDSAPRPAARPSDAARGEAASWEDDTSRPGESPAAAGTGGGVLVVDDNADMRAYLSRLLGPLWTVRTTANGEEALRAVAERQPDVVLTDVMMPRVDGFQLLRALRSDPDTRHIPVIMLTARAGQEASVEGLEAGADDYLAKPFRADELVARVRVALERAAGRAAPVPAPHGISDRAPATVPLPAAPRPAQPTAVVAVPPPPRAPEGRSDGSAGRWRLPSEASAIPVLRRALRGWLTDAGVDEDQAYDLLLAACEAATNAVEHAQEPSERFVDVTAAVADGCVRISVRDHGQWRERVASMDRGRGSTLMSAFGEVTATPSPEGTTVVITSPLAELPPRNSS